MLKRLKESTMLSIGSSSQCNKKLLARTERLRDVILALLLPRSGISGFLPVVYVPQRTLPWHHSRGENGFDALFEECSGKGLPGHLRNRTISWKKSVDGQKIPCSDIINTYFFPNLASLFLYKPCIDFIVFPSKCVVSIYIFVCLYICFSIPKISMKKYVWETVWIL